MKKKNYLLIFLLVLSCLLFCFAMACNKPTDKPNDDNPNNPPDDKTLTIAEIAKSGKNGTKYTDIEGVVYGVVSDGYFIADSSAGIFVADTTSVTVGDKLKVEATLNVASNVPSLKEATVTKTASSQTALAPTASSLKELNSYAAGRANYYKYLSLSGTLTQTSGTYSLVEGTDKLIFDSRSNTSHFADYVGSKVDLSVITTGYSTGWEGVFVGGASDIDYHKTDLNEVKAAIFASVAEALPEDAYLALNLPTTYATEPNVKYEWSVVSGSEAVSITDNVATVTEPSATTQVTLKLTLKNGEQTAEQTFDVNVKAATTVTIADVDNTTFGVVVKVEGKIVAKGFSQTQDRITVLLSDDDGNLIGLDVTRASYNKYTLGDTVKTAATYTKATEVTAAHLNAIEDVLVSSDPDWSVDYSQLNATELATDEDYAAFITNPGANSNKLYKIVSPWLIYSGNTTYNFVRFGSNAVNAQGGYTYTAPDAEKIAWYYCFPRNALSATVEGLEEELNVPFLNAGAKEYKAYTIYAYAMHQGGTTWQFVVPEMSAVVVDLSIVAEAEIQTAIGETTISASEAGTLTLPASTETAGAITWTSSNDTILNASTGAYEMVTENTTVTLTAHYTIGTEEKTYDVVIELLAGDPEYITVSEALEMGDGVIPFLKAVVIGFGPNTGTGIPGGAQMGVFVSDGMNVLYIPEGQFDRSDDSANYDKVYTIPYGEEVHRIEVGDELYFNKATLTGKNIALGTKVTLNDQAVELDWAPAGQIEELTSFADMQTYFSNSENTFKLVKFTGTADSPLYLGGSSSTYDSLNLKIYFGDIEGGVTANSVKINGVTVAAKARSSEHSLGLLWWKELNPDMPEAFAGTDTKYGFTGSVYAVWTASTSTYMQLALLSEGFTLKALTDVELAEKEIIALVNTEISAAAAGTVTLPASTDHVSGITWTSSNNEVLNAETGAYTAVTEETVVTLTAHYTIEEVEYTVEISVKLIPAVIVPLTVTEAIAQGGEVAVLKDAVFAGFAPAHSGSGYPVAFYLSDGISVVTVTTAGGQIAFTDKKAEVKLGETVLEVGHKLTLTNVTVTGNTLSCGSLTTGEIAEEKVDISGSWFNPDAENLTVIDSNEDLAAWMANVKKLGTTEYNGAANKYEVVKVVATEEAPIYIGAVAKYFLTMYYLDAEKTDSTTAADASYDVAEGANTGSKVPYFGTHTTSLALNVGDQWVLDNTPMTALGAYADYAFTATPGTDSAAGTYAFTGEFYFVYEYAGSASYPYIYVGVLGAGFNLTRVATVTE